jgi:phage I-like protein
MSKNYQKATCGATPITFAVTESGARVAPEWIPLLPAGELVLARDGRTFIPDHPAAVAAFSSSGMSMPLDWDHALDSYGVAPGSSKAAAWIDRLEARDGGLWGHVEVWTANGRASVESLEYRYISPVIYFDDDRRVVSIPRASLVNNPALLMPALCREKNMQEHVNRLLAGLDLAPETLSEEQVGTVLETFQRGKTDLNGLGTHIPVEQYEAVVGELAQVKATLETYQAAQHQERVGRVIKDALSSGRLMPSERSFFEAQAAKDLSSVETFLASRSPIVGGSKAVSILSNSADPASLTEKELAMAKAANITPAAFSAAKSRLKG